MRDNTCALLRNLLTCYGVVDNVEDKTRPPT
jgi:hypothetical protein